MGRKGSFKIGFMRGNLHVCPLGSESPGKTDTAIGRTALLLFRIFWLLAISL
jgi:hypothetical protein